MTEGEWKTNYFAEPDVRKVVIDLQEKNFELQMEIELVTRYTAWVDATYPNMRAEYQAIKDLEDAGKERVAMYGFGEAQAKAEGGHVSY